MTSRILGIALGATLAAPAIASAQDPGQPPAGPPGQVEAELIVRREVFRYPAFPRRNPFEPVRSVAQGEVSAAELRLIGVILSSDPAQSVAVVGTSVAIAAEDGSGMAVTEEGDSFYLRVGQAVGNITLVEIHADRIVVDVAQFGLTDRLTIPLMSGIPGGNR